MSSSAPPMMLSSVVVVTVLLAPLTFATGAQGSPRCEKATARRLAALGDVAQRCLGACRAAVAPGRSCSADAPDAALARCLQRARRKAGAGIRRACGRVDVPLDDIVRTVLSGETCGNGVVDDGEACDPLGSPTCPAGLPCLAACTSCGPPAYCGDGQVSNPETCDESAPSNGGCPDGLHCVVCLFCDARCGDGRITPGLNSDEVCDPAATPTGCAAGEECVGCGACGTPVPAVTADEDVTPCDDGIGDRWTFDVAAGTVVTVSADTVDDATAAKLGLEATCGPAPLHGFRAGVGFPCAFTPPNNPNPGYGCPSFSFVAPVAGSCTLTVGVSSRLDVGDGRGCADAATARYRLSVSGTALTLVGDDVPPGLVDR